MTYRKKAHRDDYTAQEWVLFASATRLLEQSYPNLLYYFGDYLKPEQIQSALKGLVEKGYLTKMPRIRDMNLGDGYIAEHPENKVDWYRMTQRGLATLEELFRTKGVPE